MNHSNTAIYAIRDIAPIGVREDSEFYIPDLLSDEDYEPDPAASAAAEEYTKRLFKAERLMDEVHNLLGVLRASIEQDGDSRAMQIDTVLKIVEKKLEKAHDEIDRQGRRDRNLFLAYFDPDTDSN